MATATAKKTSGRTKPSGRTSTQGATPRTPTTAPARRTTAACTVSIERGDDGTWTGTITGVPSLRGSLLQATSVDALRRKAMETLRLHGFGTDPGDADDVEWQFRLGDTALDRHVARVRAERKKVREAERNLDDLTADLAAKLTGKAMTPRDIGPIAGISRERAAQLAGG